MAIEQRINSLPKEHKKRKKKKGALPKPPTKKKAIDRRSNYSDQPDDEHLIDNKESMSSGHNNILVALRVRPLLRKEMENGSRNIIRVLDGKVVVILDPGVSSDDVLRINRNREKRYAFDTAFDETATQEQVFDNTVSFLIDGVLNGYNATVFAYGATGSGKTFTMLGSDTKPGLMFLTLQSLFDKAAAFDDKQYRVTLSYIEVYNETIRDLLNPSDQELDLREDNLKGIKVVGVTELQANSAEEIMELLRRGNKFRTQEPTNMNEESSRSHAVLQVVVEQREKTRNTSETVRIGKLSLIDLAGSERAAVSQNRGLRLLEGANINRSLLALGNCINALGDKANKGSYVPYRDSKLTRLLKDSLGGNCRTVMIATISPADLTVEDTTNTLKYANRAKHIKTKVTRNVLSVNHHIAQYNKIISDLREEISDLKTKLTNQGTRPGSGLHSKLPPIHGHRDFARFTQQKEELVRNFEDRMQIRQVILDIEAQETQNRIACNSMQIELSKAEAQIPTETPKSVAKSRKELATLIQNMQKNAGLMHEYEEKLNILESRVKVLRKELQELATTPEMQEILELLYRTHVLELENLELASASGSYSSNLKEKELQIQKLELQIHLRDNIIAEDRMLLTKHGIPFDDNSDSYNVLKFNSPVPFKSMDVHTDPALVSIPRYRNFDSNSSNMYEKVQRAYNSRRAMVERENQLKKANQANQSRSNSSKKLTNNSKISSTVQDEMLEPNRLHFPSIRGSFPPSNMKVELKKNHSNLHHNLPNGRKSQTKLEHEKIQFQISPMVFSKRNGGGPRFNPDKLTSNNKKMPL